MRKELARNIYEIVSAFSNRYGGYFLLGVEDDGKVSGVNPYAVDKMKKDFANSLNNPQRFASTLFLADVFKTTLPLSLANCVMSDNEALNDKVSGNVSDNWSVSDKAQREKILAHIAINGEISASEAAKILGRNPKTARRVLLELVNEGIVATSS